MIKKVRVLFVCLGNICRSPAAEGVMKELVIQEPKIEFHIESCGLGNWHLGHPPDERMQKAAEERGIQLTSRAQEFHSDFLDSFDYLLAADRSVLRFLIEAAKTEKQKQKIHLMTAYSSHYKGEDVPDPYHLGHQAFEHVLDILEDSCQGLFTHIKKS